MLKSLSIGILAWKSGQTLVDTLTTYHINGLLSITDDVKILFQEYSEQDLQIANHFGVQYIALPDNIGIGKGFLTLAKKAKYDNILLLEHDWHLVENSICTLKRLQSGLELLTQTDIIKYRHRTNPGYPLFSANVYKGNELKHYDSEIDLISPHLLESVHWLDPHKEFPDKVSKVGEYFTTTSRWGNWTNNPILVKKKFYIEVVNSYAGGGIDLEGNIAKWWSRQNFKVAHGEGLFSHKDIKKFKK